MLAQKLRALAQQRANLAPPAPIDERPGCTYGAVTRQRVADLDAVVGRIEAKLNALLGGLALFLAVEVLKAVRP
ncbi:MAG: hypothetical protein ACYC4L_15275 [Chloroflexota bacterium]